MSNIKSRDSKASADQKAASSNASGSSSTKPSEPAPAADNQDDAMSESDTSFDCAQVESDGGDTNTEDVSEQILDQKWIEWFLTADESDGIDLEI